MDTTLLHLREHMKYGCYCPDIKLVTICVQKCRITKNFRGELFTTKFFSQINVKISQPLRIMLVNFISYLFIMNEGQKCQIGHEPLNFPILFCFVCFVLFLFLFFFGKFIFTYSFIFNKIK